MQQMFLGLGAKVIEHTVSDGDTDLNASTIFGSDFADSVNKRIICLLYTSDAADE